MGGRWAEQQSVEQNRTAQSRAKQREGERERERESEKESGRRGSTGKYWVVESAQRATSEEGIIAGREQHYHHYHHQHHQHQHYHHKHHHHKHQQWRWAPAACTPTW